MSDNQIEQYANDIFQHLVNTQNGLIGVRPLEDFSEEELVSFVDTEFNTYGINHILIGDITNSTEITINLKTSSPLKNMGEVKDLLHKQVETYLKDFEKNCQKCKARVYDLLRDYQDEQRRKKQDNPFFKQ